MANEIKKIEFSSNSSIEFEIIPLYKLTAAQRKLLTNPHRTNFYHIFLFENCQPIHIVDFQSIKIEPYSMLFVDKDRVHQFDRLLDYYGIVMIFTEEFFCTTESETKFLKSSILFNDIANNVTVKLNKMSFEKYINICYNMIQELDLPVDNFKIFILKNHLYNFLLFAEREKRKQGSPQLRVSIDLDYTLRFRNLLELYYMKFKNVKKYAQMIFISEKRLGQATSKVLGKLPKEIINERILLEAKRLLAHTNLSIKKIGHELGFEDPAYFVRYFKKNALMTPVEFRNQFLKL